MKSRFAVLFAGIVDEFRWIFSEKSVLLILVAVPFLYSFIISFLYEKENPEERPAIIVDSSNSSISRKLSFMIDATREIRVIKREAVLEKGFESVQNGEAELLIFIPENFDSLVKKGEQSSIKLWIQSANMLTYGTSYPALYNALNALGKELTIEFFLDKGVPSKSAENRISPIFVDEKLLYHPTLAYGNFLVTGIFLIVIQQVILISLAFSIGLRREKGYNTLHHKFPFTAIEAKIFAHIGFYIAGIAFIVFFVFPLFGWHAAFPAAMFFLFIVFSLSLAPLAIAVASFMRDRVEAFQILMFVSTPLYMISGFTWPLEQMPRYLQIIAACFPSTPALQALRIFSVKSGDISLVMPYLVHIAILFVVYLLIAIVATRRRIWLPKLQKLFF